MFGLNPRQILSETSSDHCFVWIAQQQGGADSQRRPSARKLISSIEMQDASAAAALHDAGHATYCRAPPELEQLLVSRLLADTGMGCGQYDPGGERGNVLGRGEVEVFMGTKEHLTDWHYDFQDNFTIQLSGSKRWTLRQGTVRHPLRGCTPHYAAPEAVESQLKAARLSQPDFLFETPGPSNSYGETESVLLQAGDTLYFPAGMWHRVETVEPGVSMNISLMAKNYAALTCEALHHVLLKEDSWRQAVVHGGSSHEDAVRHLDCLLKTLPDICRNLADRVGASAILPPVLLQPPAFVSTVGGAMDDHEGEEDGSASDDEGSEGDRMKEGGIEEAGSSEAEAVDDMSDIENEHMVDVGSFAVPKSWRASKRNVRVEKNPLALLTKMQDIQRFYKEDSVDAYDGLFVLNVNYAGNEMHESSLRVILRDDPETNILDYYSKESNHSFVSFQKSAPSNIACLVYYGLLLEH